MDKEQERAEKEKLWDRYRQLIKERKYDIEQAKTMGCLCFTVEAHERCGTMQECFKLLISFVEESKTEQEYIRKAMKTFIDC